MSGSTLANLLWEYGTLLAPFLAIETCTSAASCTVPHDIVLIPQLNRFTNRADQCLVAFSRATGVSVVIAPVAPQVNFVNTLFMTSWLLNTNLVSLQQAAIAGNRISVVIEELEKVLVPKDSLEPIKIVNLLRRPQFSPPWGFVVEINMPGKHACGLR